MKDGTRIESIRIENGNTVRAKMFIDATYKGDLMAAAGVSYHVGREGNAAYGETIKTDSSATQAKGLQQASPGQATQERSPGKERQSPNGAR